MDSYHAPGHEPVHSQPTVTPVGGIIGNQTRSLGS